MEARATCLTKSANFTQDQLSGHNAMWTQPANYSSDVPIAAFCSSTCSQFFAFDQEGSCGCRDVEDASSIDADAGSELPKTCDGALLHPVLWLPDGQSQRDMPNGPRHIQRDLFAASGGTDGV